MTTLEKIKKMIEADKAVVGKDFHQRIYESLKTAMDRAGVTPEEADALDSRSAERRKIMTTPFSGLVEPQLDELEKNLCLSADYEIPSHRKGLLGAFNRLVKKAVLKIKLRADVQVSQQARFNLAVLVLARMTAVHVDLLAAALEREIEKRETLEKDVAGLEEEISRLRERR
ncbi:MAG: hypothetical protein ACNS63_02200 [Candidatus Nitrospinota bacterium M3_3B_026]